MAFAFGMNLKELMLVYWVQSIMIGLSFFVRILSLKRFSTEGMKTYRGPMPETTGTKISVAGLAIGALAFGANHVYSMFHNIRKDRLGSPKLSEVMFIPYARAVPMHATILNGSELGIGTSMLLLFIVLKTVAGVFMHVFEHHVLASCSMLTVRD